MVQKTGSSKPLLQRLKTLTEACFNMGFTNTLLYIHKTKILRYLDGRYATKGFGYRTGILSTNQLLAPVVFRYNSSDISVFSQIFITDEYRPLSSLPAVKSIIDCGAYVGYSSAYFLSKFPQAHVFAIEPDRNNYELLRQNLSVYGDRAMAINSAVWPCRIGLKVCPYEFGKESEWATSVRECREGEKPDLESVDIETLLKQSGYNKIDILKVDIEGAELLLFSANVEGWIRKVRAFAIELHNDQCSKVFHGALGSGAFDFTVSGEITIAKRR